MVTKVYKPVINVREWDEYKKFCKDNGLKECYASSIDKFKEYLKTIGRKLG